MHSYKHVRLIYWMKWKCRNSYVSCEENKMEFVFKRRNRMKCNAMQCNRKNAWHVKGIFCQASFSSMNTIQFLFGCVERKKKTSYLIGVPIAGSETLPSNVMPLFIFHNKKKPTCDSIRSHCNCCNLIFYKRNFLFFFFLF